MLTSANFSLGTVKKHKEWLLCVNNISTREAPKSPVQIGFWKINFDARMKEVAESLASKSQVHAALEIKEEIKDKNKEKIKKTSNI